jgi:outer membrane protein assembly factor BamB
MNSTEKNLRTNWDSTENNSLKFILPSSWSHPSHSNQYGNRLFPYEVSMTPLQSRWSARGIGTAGGIPVIDSSRNLIYCPTINGLSTLNATTGEVVWSTDYPFRASSPIHSSAGILYMLVNNCLYSVMADTGDFSWKSCVPAGSGFMNSPVLSPVTATLFFTVGSTLYSSNPTDGSILWSKRLTDSDAMSVLYFPIFDREGNIYLLLSGSSVKESRVTQLTPTGNIYWTFDLPCQSFSSLLWTDSKSLYVACGTKLFSYHTAYFFQNWEYNFQTPIGLSSPVFDPTHGSLVIATSHASVYSLSEEGSLRWNLELTAESAPLAESALNSPILDSIGRIYVTNALGKLHVISSDGKLLWVRESFQLLRVFSYPVITPTGGMVIIESAALKSNRNSSDALPSDLTNDGRIQSQYSLTLLTPPTAIDSTSRDQ